MKLRRLAMQWSQELHEAASKGDTGTLQQCLEQGNSPNAIGGQVCWVRGASEINTRTPLHYSAKGGHLHCVRLLLRYGADPNAKDGDGYTPIHYICQIHNPSGSEASKTILLCLQSLMDFGGKWKARTASGHTPMDIARKQKNSVCANELQKRESQVQPLLVLSRYAVSALTHTGVVLPAEELWIPESLKRYLLFEDIITEWIRNK